MLWNNKSSANKTKDIGTIGENIAANHLVKQGLVEVMRNFNCRLGEIDLIMTDQQALVFIEVKYRKNSHFGSPSEMVTNQKQKRIIRSAQYYLQRNPKLSNKACRFDVISIQQSDIEWIKNAFDAF